MYESVEILGLIFGFAALMTFGIIFGVLHHKEKMEGIRRTGFSAITSAEIERLKHEVAALKELVHQQAIAVDDLSALRPRISADAQPVHEQTVR